MLSVEARPLTAAERDFLLAEKAGPPSRAFLIGAAAFVLALLPALGALIGINLGAALGFPSRPSAMAGVLVVLAANAVGAWISWRFMDRMRAWLRRSVARQLATAHQETWRFDAVRAWTIECAVTRAILFELGDGRMLAVASRHFETLPPDTFPGHVELDAVPTFDRVERLTMSAGVRPVQPGRVTLEEVGIGDLPIKKRRFVEVAPDHLSEAVRRRLGLGAAAPRDIVRVPSAHVLRRATTLDEKWKRYRQLLPRRVELVARALTWLVPILVVLILLAGPLLPGLRAFLRVDGVKPSLAPIAFAGWCACAIYGDSLRRRSVARLLAGDLSALPPAWTAAGSAKLRRGRVTEPVTALLRRRLVLYLGGDVLTGDVFRLATPAGEVTVEVAHAWLAHGDREVWRRLDASDVHCLAASVGSAPPEPGRRWYFRPEERIGAGDDVTVLGFSSEDGRRMFGTAEWPVLVWLEGTEVDQSGL